MSTELHVHTKRCWWNFHEARWVCPPERETETSLVDVRDMIVVHTALLREFRLAPEAVSRVRAGDVKQAGVVDGHLGFLCDLLHHHHEGEDRLLWPLLRERVSAEAQRQLDAGEAQHVGIDAALDRVAEARTAWTRQPDHEARAVLATSLADLHSLLREHLDYEERSVLPLAAALLTEDEWNAVGAAAAASMPKPALVLAIGMFAYEGDPAVLATMLSSAPAVPRFVVPRLGPRVYARRARRVYGTSRP